MKLQRVFRQVGEGGQALLTNLQLTEEGLIEPGGEVAGGVADLAMPWSWQVREVEVNETTTQHAATDRE